MARIGKISALPFELREQVNQRLLDGQPGSVILPWLNGLADVLAILKQRFEGKPITDQNLSEWRQGGFLEWQARRDRLAHTRELTRIAADLARADGGSISEGSAAIAGGQILQLLESCEGKLGQDDLGKIISSLTNLRAADVARQKLDLDKTRLKQKDEELALARQKFQRESVGGLSRKWNEDPDVRRILGGAESDDAKTEALGRRIFGDLWDDEKE